MQMRYLSDRQVVLSQNIANIDTPRYKSKDLKPVDFAELASASSSQLSMRSTSPKHLGNLRGGTGFRSEHNRTTFETSPTQNNVGLEEEMAKISRTGADYQVASSLYKKFTGMYRAALGK